MNIYGLAKVVCLFATKVLFRPKISGLENIPKSGRFIIALNHTSMFDPVVIVANTKRRVHFLAKSELFKFPKSIIFNHLGLIKVYRNEKGKEALEDAIEYLKKDHVIGIFPEGTRERGRGLLPFKYGCVKMANETNCPIIPVGISGGYNIFKNKLCFNVGKPIHVSGNLEKDNELLRNKVKDLIN